MLVPLIRKTILLTFALLVTTATMSQTNYGMAKKIAYDKDIDGFRYIQSNSISILTPGEPINTINISLNYYEGHKNPYFLLLDSRTELSEKDEVIITFSNKEELHLFATSSGVSYSHLGIYIKKVAIYDVTYFLDEQQLNDIISNSIVAIKIGSEGDWHEWRINKLWSNKDVGKWLKMNYKAINKRLSNPKYWKRSPLM